MSFEQVAELQIFAEHVEALVPAEPLELGGVGAGSHAGAEGAAFQAVAAELAPREARRGGTGLDDPGDRARGERCGAKAGQGRGRVRRCRRCPDPPEYGAIGNIGGVKPGGERAHRTEGGTAVGQGDGDRSGLRALAAWQSEFEALVGAEQISQRDGGELGAAQGAGEPHQDQRALAPAGQVVLDRRQQFAQHGLGGGALLRGVGGGAAYASAMVSDTSRAVSVGEAQPAAWCR